MSDIRIAIVYHSGYGHTARQAEAVKSGVNRVEGAEALLRRLLSLRAIHQDFCLHVLDHQGCFGFS